MDSSVKYVLNNDALIITIKPNFKLIIKVSIWLMALIPITVIYLTSDIIYSVFSEPLILKKTIILSSLFLILTFSSFIYLRYVLRRLYKKDIIKINTDSITLIRKFIFKTKKKEFSNKDILDLRYGETGYTKHALDIDGFDYLGVGKSEKEMQFFIDEGNISFYYKGSNFRFGRDVNEEVGNEIINKIKSVSGFDFTPSLPIPKIKTLPFVSTMFQHTSTF